MEFILTSRSGIALASIQRRVNFRNVLFCFFLHLLLTLGFEHVWCWCCGVRKIRLQFKINSELKWKKKEYRSFMFYASRKCRIRNRTNGRTSAIGQREIKLIYAEDYFSRHVMVGLARSLPRLEFILDHVKSRRKKSITATTTSSVVFRCVPIAWIGKKINLATKLSSTSAGPDNDRAHLCGFAMFDCQRLPSKNANCLLSCISCPHANSLYWLASSLISCKRDYVVF